MDPYRAAMPPVNYGYEQQQAAIYAKDQQDLKVLSICHYVYAGFMVFTALLMGLYLLVGAAILAGGVAPSGKPAHGEEAIVGTIMIILFGTFIAFFLVKAALLVYSGMSLRRCERKLLSQVVAGLSCINVPFGTALGVYTFVVLARPSVAMLYARNRTA